MNMAPRQRKPRAPARQAAPRIVTIRDSEHLSLIKHKLGSRLLILLYRTASQSSKAMQGFFADASRQQNLRHVVFGEVDGADPVTSTVAAEREVTTFPTVEAWKQGKCVARVVGGYPGRVIELINEHAGKADAYSRSPLLSPGVGAVAAAAAALLLGVLSIRRFRRQNDYDTRHT